MGHKILTVPYLIFPPDTKNNMNHAGPVNQINWRAALEHKVMPM